MLTPYIKDLLFTHDDIIIPNFGCLTSKTVSAQIDETTNTLIPPKKVFDFDAEKTVNDGILIKYVAEKDNITTGAAFNFVNFQVDEWKEKLKQQDLTLEEIGTFSLDGFGNLHFDPNKTSNFLADSFGLSNIESNSFDDEAIEDTVEEVVEKSPKVEYGPIDNQTTESNFTEYNTAEDSTIASKSTNESFEAAPVKKRKRKVNKGKWYTYVIIFGFFSGIGWLLWRTIMKNERDLKEINAMRADQNQVIDGQIQNAIFEIKEPLKNLRLQVAESSIIGEDPDMESMDGLVNNNNDEATNNEIASEGNTDQEDNTPVENNAVAEEVTPPTKVVEKEPYTPEPKTPVNSRTTYNNPNHNYYIIAGAFGERANADKKINQLRSQGYSGAQIIEGGSLTKVAFGSYSTMQEAKIALSQISASAPDAWILKK